jgi:hypothetical protein
VKTTQITIARITKTVSSADERATEIQFAATKGTNYRIQRHDEPVVNDHFAPVSGVPASSPKRLGSVQIGIFSEGNDGGPVGHIDARLEEQ